MPTILLKKSDTPGSVPGTANLTNLAGGVEVAVNTADKRVYSMTSASAVIELGTNPSSLTCSDGSFVLLKAASASITNLTATSIVISNLSIASANITTLTSASATITNLLGTTLTISGNSFLATSSGNVGVGTTSPAAKLEAYNSAVNGAFVANTLSTWRVAQIRNDQTGTSGSAAGIAFVGKTDTQPAGIVAINGNTTGGVVSLGFLTVDSNVTTERMRITSDGNLGLGVTPSAWNPVYRAFNIGSRGFVYSRTDNDETSIGVNWYRNSSAAYVFAQNGYATSYIQGSGVHAWYNSTNNTSGANASLTLTQAMTLDTVGNLGIGTTSPSDILTLAGGASGSYGLTINNAKVGGGTKAIFQYDATNQIALVGGNTTNGLAFQTLTGGSLTSKVWLDSSGNLGIGTASPAGKLDVSRSSFGVTGRFIALDGTNNPRLLIYGSSSGTTIQNTWSSGATNLMFANGGSEGAGNVVATFDVNGNLGLGVTPSAWGLGKAIEVGNAGNSIWGVQASDIRIGANMYYNGSVYKYINAATAAWFGVNAGGSGGFSFNINNNTPSAGGTATFTQAMTLNASNNLLLGTTSDPGYGRTTASVYNTNGGLIQVAGSATTALFYVYQPDNIAVIGTTTNHPFAFYSNNTERGRFTSGGNFEIGSQAGTGTRTLTIQTNTSGDPTLVLSAAGADSGQFWFERSTVRLYARASNTGGVYLASGGTSWTAVSDERKKDIIEPITNAAEKVASLRAVVGKYKTDQDGVRRSFLIAQDVQAVFPEAIDASDENELGLSYTDTIPLLVAAIKELKAELDAAKAKIAALEAK